MIAQLIQKAESATKVKGFDTYQGQAVKFLGSQIETVTVDLSTYEAFTAHLKANGWQIGPLPTSGGFVAKRAN